MSMDLSFEYMIDLKCNQRHGCEKSQNSKYPKKFLLDISAKSQWILAYDTAFERSEQAC